MTVEYTTRSPDALEPIPHASESGLASLFLGAVLFLVAPMTTGVAVLVWRFADTSPMVVLLHAWLARGGVLLGALVGLASIICGLRGIRSAKKDGQSGVLARAGLFLGLAATAAWIIASIGLLNTTESLLYDSQFWTP